MPKSKDKWNVTFRKAGGKWSKPWVYVNFPNAQRRLYWDDTRGSKISGKYEIEIRRGATRSGKLIRQFKPYMGSNPHRREI